MIAAHTPVPVIGVPIKSSNSIDGWDSILSILQMPSGIPVATMALDGSVTPRFWPFRFWLPETRL